MKVYILITLLASALVQASQGAAIENEINSNINFGTALKMYYSSFQRIMPCGYSPLNIPVLAPITVDYYRINVTNENYNITGNIANLEVTGMNNFRILGGDFNATTNRTTFDYIFPQLQILGEYDVSAVAKLAGYPVNTAGKGLINVKIEDYRVVGNFVLTPSSKLPYGLEVTDANLHFYLGNVINNSWNNLWDIAVNNFHNKFTAEAIMLWAQEFQLRINDVYGKFAVPQINQLLKDLTMKDLIELLVSLSAQFDMIECNAH